MGDGSGGENVHGWLKGARQGSREALGQLLEAYRPYLLQIANQKLEADLQAKAGGSDIVQQTFLEAQRDFRRFTGSTAAELLAWLRQILNHNLLNFSAQYRATARRQVSREVSLHERGGPNGAATLPAPDPSPSSQVVAQETATALDRALQRLPPDYQQVIVGRNRDRLSFAEIGRAMNRSAGAARKLWLRAVERLDEEIGPDP